MHILLSIPLLMATGISIPLVIYAWKKRAIAGAIPLMIIVLSMLIWTSCAAIQLFVDSPSVSHLLTTIQFVGIATLPPSWLAFSMCFTGRYYRLKSWHFIFALAFGIAMVGLVATNGKLHRWVWHNVERDGQIYSETWIVFWIFIVYIYASCLTSIAIILERMLHSSSVFRWQCWIIILAGLIPLTSYPLYTLKIIPFHVDPTPYGFFLSTLLIGWGLFRFRILDLTPIAQSILIDSMSDGMLVIDDHMRIVDMNKAIRSFFDELPTDIIGQRASDTIPIWSQLQPLCTHGGQCQSEVEWCHKDQHFILEVRATTLTTWQGVSCGCLLILRDITALRNALNEVKILTGLLPICSHCKKIRDDQGFWMQVESYVSNHSEAVFSHSICPDCANQYYSKYLTHRSQSKTSSS